MWQPLRGHIGIEDNKSCYGALMLRYPQPSYKKIPVRNPAKITWV